MFKKALKFLWKLPRTIFNKINECEENFLRQFDETYTSKLGKNAIFYGILSELVFVVFGLLIFKMLAYAEMNPVLCIILTFLPPVVFTALYTIFYIKKRLPMIQGRKWWYCIQVALGLWFGLYVILAPIAILAGLLYAAFIVVVVVLVLWIALAIIAGDSGSSGKKRWKLDNGDEVEEQKGLFGTKHYQSRWSGQEYEKDGDKFREK